MKLKRVRKTVSHPNMLRFLEYLKDLEIERRQTAFIPLNESVGCYRELRKLKANQSISTQFSELSTFSEWENTAASNCDLLSGDKN